MRLQLAEHARPLPHPVAQNARHRQRCIVVQDRARHLAEEAERGVVPVTERFSGFRRIGLHETGVAVRQVHRKEVDLALHPGDFCQCLAEIHLCMTRIVPQRHEYLAMPQPPRQHVVLYDGDPAGVAVLVAKPLEDPLRGMLSRLPEAMPAQSQKVTRTPPYIARGGPSTSVPRSFKATGSPTFLTASGSK